MSAQDLTSNIDSGVAIVGVACRFPGASDARSFWTNLCDGVESIRATSNEELLGGGLDEAALADPKLIKAAAVLPAIDEFDAEFFGYSPREAELMDPQQRLFLEAAWAALEDAGYDPEQFPGLIGVFGGSGVNTYLWEIMSSVADRKRADGLQATIGNDKDYLTTRVSYKLNLRGPSVCVQTACSSSLVAVHLACQNLLDFECDMALAGGVSIRSPQPLAYLYQEGSILSPDGHCRTFDSKAMGTIFGNGLGLVVLKRLEEAIKDRDHIYAIIRGSAINNDGADKVGYTAPSVRGQSLVLQKALAAAGVSADSISYIESHGTGTKLGDAIELAALKEVLGKRPRRCGLGSVKTNIGHLDTAAGVAGLIKTALALHHRVIPPSLHFQNGGVELGAEDRPFDVVDRLSPWSGADGPRRAGVSSFGIGGTNAHVVLEEGPAVDNDRPARAFHPLLISARNEQALDAARESMIAFLQENQNVAFPDIAYTTQVGRRSFSHRRAIVARDARHALALLENRSWYSPVRAPSSSARPNLVFMFPGQGSQHVNMARGLYHSEPVFRDSFDACARILETQIGFDLRQKIYPATVDDNADKELSQTLLAQPSLFAIEYALTLLWREWGIAPDSMIGHSVGEYVAATIAGVMSLEEALAIIAARARFMQQQTPGSMLAIHTSEQQLLALVNGQVEVAAVNAPSLCVASGPHQAIEALAKQLETLRIPSRKLHTSHAYHSRLMEPMLEPFLSVLNQFKFKPPQVPFISNVTGTWITAAQATDPQYWARHVRSTVRFHAGMVTLRNHAQPVFLEVGPGRTLCKLAAADPTIAACPSISTTCEQAGGEDELTWPTRAIASLWLEGIPVNWAAFQKDQPTRRTSIPTYPFQRKSYWVSKTTDNADKSKAALSRRQPLDQWAYSPCWKQSAPLPVDAPLDSAVCLLIGPSKLASALRDTLVQRGGRGIVVESGADFEKRGPDEICIDFRQPAHYERLLAETFGKSCQLPLIVDMRALNQENSRAPKSSDGFRHFDDLALLSKAVARHPSGSRIKLHVLSNRLFEIIGNESVDPWQALLAGPCLVLPQESPNTQTRLVDLDFTDLPVQSRLASLLIDEISSESDEPFVAYRGNRRWVRGFEAVPFAPPPASKALRPGGNYLISGGLGGIGLALAKWLAKKWQANIMLFGRRGLPEEQKWDSLLQSLEPSDSRRQQIEAIREIRQLGGQVHFCAADVNSEEDVQRVVIQAQEELGSIDGVFHLAAVSGGGMIQLKELQNAHEVMIPKIIGALNLRGALASRPPFFALFSSITAVVGGFGQVDYCSANAFLDAFAHQCRARGERVVSINWDAWKWDTWQNASTAALPELQQRMKKHRELYGIGFDEGFEVLERILDLQIPQVTISTQSLEEVIRAHRNLGKTASLTRIATSEQETQGTSARVATDASEVGPLVARVWKEVLGVQEIASSDTFTGLGGHSLSAVHLISRLREEIGGDISMDSIFRHPTFEEFVQFVEQQQQPAHELDEEAAQLLDEIELMSEEAVRQGLSEEAVIPNAGS